MQRPMVKVHSPPQGVYGNEEVQDLSGKVSCLKGFVQKELHIVQYPN
jgi:hypothetical protein